MQYEQVKAELQKLGDKRAVAVWQKMGMDTANYWGVGLTNLKNFSKKIKKNHQLAEQLRKSGIRDALLLSFMIDEPQKISKLQAKNILKLIDFWDSADNFCSYILVNTPYVFELIDEWKDSSKEMTKRCAYISVSELAKNGKKIEENYFIEFLVRIEKEIGYSKNWVREAMLYALINIGSRSDSLRTKAIDVAGKIGRIEIDYGETSCKAPDPIKHLSKEKLRSGAK